MAKLSQERIMELIKAYQELGTYSGAAKATGSSPATVKKYVEAFKGEVPKQNINLFDGSVSLVSDINFPTSVEGWVTLTSQEQEELIKLQEEM